MHRQVRLATPADAAAVREIYAPYVESTAITFAVDPPSTAELADRIETTLEQYPWLVCETESGDVLGYAAAGPFRSRQAYDWTVELSVYVAEAAHGAGIGTALYESLLAVLEMQGYRNAVAVVTLPNPESVRLHERAGFEPVGTVPAVGYKQGEWHDTQWWYRQLADHAAEPDPPRPLPAVQGTSAFDAAIDAGDAVLDR
ncbi:MAG: N-acetyltransferase family protein [Haloarculaceae archaeon]